MFAKNNNKQTKVYLIAVGVPGGAVVKNLPAKQETQVWSLSGEDPLEKEMATHSRILTWEILWTEEPGGYSPWSHKELLVIKQPYILVLVCENSVYKM